MRPLFRFLIALSLLAAPALGVAQEAQAPAVDAEPAAALAAIREMVLYARYREARTAVQTYLGREDLDAAPRNAGLELLATVHIAMRDTRSAQAVLTQLYARDPQHQLSDPDASPPVLSAFGRARSSPPEPVVVTIAHEPPALTERAPPIIALRVEGEGASAVDELRLGYRQGDDTSFTTVLLTSRDGVVETRLPILDRTEAYEVAYFVEALAPSGATLATHGSAAEPLTFTMPEGSAAGIAEVAITETPTAEGGEDLWWVGLIVALVLVGGGVTAGILLADELGGPQDGSLGTLELPVVRF